MSKANKKTGFKIPEILRVVLSGQMKRLRADMIDNNYDVIMTPGDYDGKSFVFICIQPKDENKPLEIVEKIEV